VTDMSGMFSNARKFNRPINKWKVNNVNSTFGMFHRSSNFNKKLTTWGDKLPKNANARLMFDGMKPDIVKKIAPWYSSRN